MGLKRKGKGCDLMADRFDIEQVIRILGLETRADQADDGRDFDVACRIALEKLMKCKEYEDLEVDDCFFLRCFGISLSKFFIYHLNLSN